MRVTTMTPPPRIKVKYLQLDENQLQLGAFQAFPEQPEKLNLTLWLEAGLILEFIEKVVKPGSGDIVVAVEELMRKAVEEQRKRCSVESR